MKKQEKMKGKRFRKRQSDWKMNLNIMKNKKVWKKEIQKNQKSLKKANDESEKLKATFNDDKKKAEDEKNKLSELKSTEVELQKVKSLYEEKREA